MLQSLNFVNNCLHLGHIRIPPEMNGCNSSSAKLLP